MDIKKVYFEFVEKYPSFSKNIISYKEGPNSSLEFKMEDGKTAWYYPLIAKNKKYKK